MSTDQALKLLKSNMRNLSRQQVRTIRGQILSGNIEGAVRGLERMVHRANVAERLNAVHC